MAGTEKFGWYRCFYLILGSPFRPGQGHRQTGKHQDHWTCWVSK